MPFIRFIVATFCALIFAGCGSGGIFNLNPQPDGNIAVTNPTTGATLQTTPANPFIVSGGAFSIGLTEDHFSGPYTVTITAWTAPFNVSCFVTHYVDQTDKTNLVKFSADNAAPVTAPTQPSPCNPFAGSSGTTQTDEETATIVDGHGHTVKFYYQIAGATPSNGGGSTAPTKLAVSWSGPSPSKTACGAYVLNVGAVNASGTAVLTSASNPITLSTTGGSYMGFSVATSTGAAGFACPQSTGTGSPGGAPTLQLTSSPGQVLVYFNGPSATASTTITASSVGLPPVTLVISVSVPAANAVPTISWSGASPAGTSCGAYVLNVGAVNSSGTPVPTTASNPITLSTTGGLYMGFSAATSSAGFTCPTNVAGPPGGTPTLQLTTTPAQVLVYYNGQNALEKTTITASTVGATPASLTIASDSSTTVHDFNLAWATPPGPALGTCGAYILVVKALDANGNAIVSSTYSNPIALSTNNVGVSGFSTVVAGIAPAPAPATINCINPLISVGGTPTLAVPNTATPTVVYFNGLTGFGAAPGNTTITATAYGATTRTISFP